MERLLKITIVAALALLAAAGCRKKEVPEARIAVENNYTALRLSPFSVSAGVAAEAYQWVIDSVRVTAEDLDTQLAKEAAAIRDSTVSRQEKLECTFYTEGTYFMRCLVALKEGRVEKSFRVHVVTEFQSYKPWAKLVEYRPALGNAVSIEARNVGGELTNAISVANLKLRKENKTLVYLGSFGGYATFEFDHVVQNLKNRYDFQVLRDINNRYYGRADVVVWVSKDSKRWYRLQSQYDSIAYSGSYAAGPNGAAVDGDKTKFESDDKYLFRTSAGDVKIPVKNGETELVPKWIAANWQTHRYEGYLLKRQSWDRPKHDPSDPSVLIGYEMHQFSERAYNTPPTGENPNFYGMDIDWAVDESGKPVALNSIKYVKVATGVLEAPKTWGLLESSVTLVEDLNLK